MSGGPPSLKGTGWNRHCVLCKWHPWGPTVPNLDNCVQGCITSHALAIVASKSHGDKQILKDCANIPRRPPYSPSEFLIEIGKRKEIVCVTYNSNFLETLQTPIKWFPNHWGDRCSRVGIFHMILKFSYNFIDIVMYQDFIWEAAQEVSSL